MIKAEELRLGNLLQVESGNLNVVMEVKSKSARCSYQREDTGLLNISVIDNDNLYGIPLSEKWLINFGFETDLICYEKDKFTIGHFVNYTFIWLPTGSLSSVDLGVNIKTIHQLQNLYFTITGEELTISTEE